MLRNLFSRFSFRLATFAAFVWRPGSLVRYLCTYCDIRSMVSCDMRGASLVQIMFDQTSDFGYVFTQNRMIHRMIHVMLESSGSDLLLPDSSFLVTELGAYLAKKTQADRIPSSGSLGRKGLCKRPHCTMALRPKHFRLQIPQGYWLYKFSIVANDALHSWWQWWEFHSHH